MMLVALGAGGRRLEIYYMADTGDGPRPSPLAPAQEVATCPCRALEFYSGIGGWAAALEMAKSRLPTTVQDISVVAAFDINTQANHVYSSQPGCSIRPISRGIQTLSVPELESYDAVLWMMSPPCQPFTRNNTTDKRDTADPRNQSFLHLGRLLRDMPRPPRFIALENVEGFEASESCQLWLDTCVRRGYHVQQFILSPVQIGCPNERPRYFCLARLDQARAGVSECQRSLPLELGPSQVRQIGDYLQQPLTDQEWQAFAVPDSVLAKPSAWCFDIVTPKSRRSACYTKSYGSYIKGTGSILFDRWQGRGADAEEAGLADSDDEVTLQRPEERSYEAETGWQERYRGRIRYLMPAELARLFHFPSTFRFPADLSVRKCYELLGNSIHVGLASELLVLLMEPSRGPEAREGL